MFVLRTEECRLWANEKEGESHPGIGEGICKGPEAEKNEVLYNKRLDNKEVGRF